VPGKCDYSGFSTKPQKENAMLIIHKRWLLVGLLFGSSVVATAAETKTAKAEHVSGDSVIRAAALGSEIVVTTTDRLAGAIDSLTWNGQEFIDSLDHGRQLQSACSFDCGLKQEFWPECYNPTEAGSQKDGAGATSTSKLISIRTTGNELHTQTRMAFWLAPDELSSGRPALNQKLLSSHLVTKTVRIGYAEHPNIIDYRVTFTVPEGDHHTLAQFEGLTGYMPAEFDQFYVFRADNGQLESPQEVDGEQALPLVVANAAGSHAMGIYSPDQPSPGYTHAGYGRFKFPVEKVNKWNCVFRVRDDTGIKPGDYSYQMYVAIGPRADVARALDFLTKRFKLP
jgi:hypothetical protein